MSDSGAEGSVFDLEKLRQLVELMKEHDLAEVDLCQADQQIRLARATKVEPQPMYGGPMPAMLPQSAAPQVAAAKAESEPTNIAYIKSPMVGTFYLRPNPDAEPFVKPGDVIHKDTVVCIIEAMKVFNEIPAEIEGRVLAVLVESEEPVEFGKPLLKIDTKL